MTNLRRVDLPPDVRGGLWLSSMPGRFASWSDFELDARAAKLALIVCLTPIEEVAQMSPAYGAAIRRGSPDWRWLHLPMPNFGVPPDREAFRAGVDRIVSALRAGDAVLLHCAAGMGRTGSAAACVLKSLGLSTPDALRRVQAAGSNPQNARQAGFVEWF